MWNNATHQRLQSVKETSLSVALLTFLGEDKQVTYTSVSRHFTGLKITSTIIVHTYASEEEKIKECVTTKVAGLAGSIRTLMNTTHRTTDPSWDCH